MSTNRKLRMGMVGGGPGAFIGEVHRKAAAMDGQIDLVAGCFDINPKKSRQMGRELFLPKKRVMKDVTISGTRTPCARFVEMWFGSIVEQRVVDTP